MRDSTNTTNRVNMCIEQSRAGDARRRKRIHAQRKEQKECWSQRISLYIPFCKILLASRNLPEPVTSIEQLLSLVTARAQEPWPKKSTETPSNKSRELIDQSRPLGDAYPRAHVWPRYAVAYECELVWSNNCLRPPNYIIQCPALHKRSRVSFGTHCRCCVLSTFPC